MNSAIQDTLLQLFEHVRHDPDSLPAISIDEWDKGSTERQLLESFRGMMEQVQQRMLILRQAEQQLREREEQYRSVFEATGDGLFVIDLDGFIVEANPAAYRQLGYTYEEIIGLHRSTIVNPEYHSLVPEYLRVIQMGDQFQGRAIDVRKDGTTFPVEVLGKAFTYKGRPHTLSVVRDITKQVQAEEQLREGEEQYRSVFEATSDGLIIVDLNGFVVQANPAACQMYGYTYEEFLGLQGTAITASDSLHLLTEALQRIKLGEKLQAPIRSNGLRKDGTTFLSEGYGTPFMYKGKPQILAVVRDVTEQVKTEQELREREEQYRSIFEATYDALAIIDLEGHYVEVNPATCQMFGYTREELIGQHASTRSATKSFTAQALETLKAGRPYAHSHFTGTPPSWGVRKDGSVFPFDAHGGPITYRGQPHSLVVARDITEQLQAQQLLEQRVEERTRELASLLEISHTVASTLQLKPLLSLILDQLKTVVDYIGSAITTRDGQDLVLIATRGPDPEEPLLHRRFSLAGFGPIWEEISRGESVIIDNVRSESSLAQTYRESVDELVETTFSYIRSWMAVPLKLKDRVIGMLSLSHSEPDHYTPRSAELAMAIANQAAVAIENAQLQELAAVEERQRLARELHDSVSQALYGISLGVHTARIQLDRDKRALSESLDYVLELSEAALIEMRALIFELRPESLETEGLVVALTKQAAALRARQNIEVITDLCVEPDLPLKVKQDLYRIAQEELHNTVKHAHASKIELRLHQTGEVVTLEVRDNGKGFDATSAFPGHLGLHSMRERVTDLGGTFQIESTPGQGTCVRVQVPWP